MITLRFVGYGDLEAAAIRAFQYGFWATHVEALIDNKLVGANLNGGVAVRAVGYDTGGFTKERYVNIEATEGQTAAFNDFTMEQVGKGYDLEAILELLLDRNWRDPNKWFCSELVAAAMEEAGKFTKLPGTFNRVLPRDVYLMTCTT
jgi:hypothetical protein